MRLYKTLSIDWFICRCVGPLIKSIFLFCFEACRGFILLLPNRIRVMKPCNRPFQRTFSYFHLPGFCELSKAFLVAFPSPGDMGGSLALFLGASLLSIFEVFDFCLQILAFKLSRRGRSARSTDLGNPLGNPIN